MPLRSAHNVFNPPTTTRGVGIAAGMRAKAGEGGALVPHASAALDLRLITNKTGSPAVAAKRADDSQLGFEGCRRLTASLGFESGYLYVLIHLF
jgi:hypothetical protein